MTNDNGSKNTELLGMKEITLYVRRSEATVLKLIREEGFPARKVGGQWVSDTTVIVEWRLDILKDIEKKLKKGRSSAPLQVEANL